MNLVDTSGWIEYLFSESNADFFAEPIEDIDNLVVSVVCLYEVFKNINLVADEAKALQAIAQMKQGQVVAVTDNIAMKVSLLSIRHGLPMVDSLIYAAARSHDAILWSQDVHFRGLPGVQYREVQTKASSSRTERRRRKPRSPWIGWR